MGPRVAGSGHIGWSRDIDGGWRIDPGIPDCDSANSEPMISQSSFQQLQSLYKFSHPSPHSPLPLNPKYPHRRSRQIVLRLWPLSHPARVIAVLMTSPSSSIYSCSSTRASRFHSILKVIDESMMVSFCLQNYITTRNP